MNNNAIPDPVTKLIDAFSALPGIGPKSASRLAFYLLRAQDDVSLVLSDALRDLKTKTTFCEVCWNITTPEQNPCGICAASDRDETLLAVVEEPLDVLAIERTGSFKGKYHVLHGAISPVNGIGPDQLKIQELLQRIDSSQILEIIVATNPGYEGDATALYIQRELANKGIRLTRLARGLPTGGDLEYVDAVTLMRALEGRSDL
jgi:recombination protein RecR